MSRGNELVTSLKVVAQQLDVPYAKVLEWRDLGCPYLQKAYSISDIQNWVERQERALDQEQLSGERVAVKDAIREVDRKCQDLLIDLVCDDGILSRTSDSNLVFSERAVSFLLLLHRVTKDTEKLVRFHTQLREFVADRSNSEADSAVIHPFQLRYQYDSETHCWTIDSITVPRGRFLEWLAEGGLTPAVKKEEVRP